MSIPPHRLFTVTLDELATYQITVAAQSEEEACSIARLTYIDARPPEDFTRIKRDIVTAATPCDGPVRQYIVAAQYRVDFEITVPATDRDTAIRHAKRLFANEPSPWDYDSTNDGVHWFSAREVVS